LQGGFLPQELGGPIDPRRTAPVADKLSANGRPNIIVMMTDDQGWDDLALHQRRMGKSDTPLKTPNMDRFFRDRATEFSSFYVSPMCSSTRSQLLTGREYARTGAMWINSGWDYLNVDESLVSSVMRDAGFTTAHFGKWHNAKDVRYAPWDRGFEHSVYPLDYVMLDAPFRYNGVWKNTTGWQEEVLMGEFLGYRGARAGAPRAAAEGGRGGGVEPDARPFFAYYAPYSIHAGHRKADMSGPRWSRPAPQAYHDKYYSVPGLARDTAQVSFFFFLRRFRESAGHH
jgi:arylsulfatase A-like enzyme